MHGELEQDCNLSLVLFVIDMDTIFNCSQGPVGVWFSDDRFSSLLFSDDVVLLVSPNLDVQNVLGWFAAKCEATRIKISSSKSKALVLNRKKVVWPLWVSGKSLPQVEELMYYRVLFTTLGVRLTGGSVQYLQ